MPINKESIISVFNDKLTLMQWLKTINKALEDAVLTGVEIKKKGNATLSFKFLFEDGTFLESNDLVLQQGESVASAYIQNGHLYLTLTNGTILDAGNVKPVSNFSIDANQHLIVNYGDGTSQDLGAIFQGNVNISGTLNATKVTGNEIIENMNGYSFVKGNTANVDYEYIYAGVVKNGNKLSLVWAVNITKLDASVSGINLGYFVLPSAVANKLYPTAVGQYPFLDNKKIGIFASQISSQDVYVYCEKTQDVNARAVMTDLSSLPANTKYYCRYEVTFLLSDNLAQ